MIKVICKDKLNEHLVVEELRAHRGVSSVIIEAASAWEQQVDSSPKTIYRLTLDDEPESSSRSSPVYSYYASPRGLIEGLLKEAEKHGGQTGLSDELKAKIRKSKPQIALKLIVKGLQDEDGGSSWADDYAVIEEVDLHP